MIGLPYDLWRHCLYASSDAMQAFVGLTILVLVPLAILRVRRCRRHTAVTGEE